MSSLWHHERWSLKGSWSFSELKISWNLILFAGVRTGRRCAFESVQRLGSLGLSTVNRSSRTPRTITAWNISILKLTVCIFPSNHSLRSCICSWPRMNICWKPSSDSDLDFRGSISCRLYCMANARFRGTETVFHQSKDSQGWFHWYTTS